VQARHSPIFGGDQNFRFVDAHALVTWQWNRFLSGAMSQNFKGDGYSHTKIVLARKWPSWDRRQFLIDQAVAYTCPLLPTCAGHY
jgi:hypothetical protein